MLKNLRFVGFSLIFLLLVGCNGRNNDFVEKAYSADYYKNLFTGEIMDKSEFQKFRDSLFLMSHNLSKGDSLEEEIPFNYTTHFYDLISGDSIIQEFKYSIRIGNEYIVREDSYEKVGMKIPAKIFSTLDGEDVQIGGNQSKPTFINLWFVGCRGCEEEMPSLNILQEKFKDKVNFISITFDSEERVKKYLKRKAFSFKHIINVDGDYIKEIGTSPYPENILINKSGEIVNIEGGLPGDTEADGKMQYFESLIENLL